MIIDINLRLNDLDLAPIDLHQRCFQPAFAVVKQKLAEYPNEPIVIELHLNEGTING